MHNKNERKLTREKNRIFHNKVKELFRRYKIHPQEKGVEKKRKILHTISLTTAFMWQTKSLECKNKRIYFTDDKEKVSTLLGDNRF